MLTAGIIYITLIVALCRAIPPAENTSRAIRDLKPGKDSGGERTDPLAFNAPVCVSLHNGGARP